MSLSSQTEPLPDAYPPQRYRAIAENAQDLVTIVDERGIILYESPSLQQWLGYKPDEMLGQNAFEFVHPDDIPRVFELFALGIEEPGYEAAMEYRFRHADGSWRMLESRAKNLLHDPDVRGVIVSSRDITQRTLTERALRESEARNRALLDAIPDAMVRISREGRYLDFQAASEYRSVVRLGDFMNKRLEDVLPPALARKARTAVEQALETGEIQTFEYEIEVEGEQRFREARVVVSGPDEVVAITRDLTERRRSERNFRELFEGSPDPIIVMTVDSTVLDVNPAATRLHEMSRERMIGQSLLSVVPTRLHDAIFAGIHALLAGTAQSIEGLVLNRKEHEIPVEVRASNVVYSGRRAVLIHARDITERKQAEQALRENREQLRQLTARLQDVREEERFRLSREVHDVMGGALTALKMDARWLADHRNDADGFGERVQSMFGLIDETIGTVRRIASELRPAVLDKFGLTPALEWWAAEFEQRTGIRCRFREEPMEVEVDDERGIAVFRIFQEILTNVARHADARAVDVLFEETADGLRLVVRDDGRGLEDDALVNTTSLGVLGMKERARAFGGDVHLTGAPGEGTTVTASIPLAASSDEPILTT